MCIRDRFIDDHSDLKNINEWERLYKIVEENNNKNQIVFMVQPDVYKRQALFSEMVAATFLGGFAPPATWANLRSVLAWH